MLSKRLQDLTPEDIKQWLSTSPHEDERLEFKETLSARGQNSDKWIIDQTEIGDKARDALCQEVIAFTNAHGGDLVLGIRETKTKPARANEINSIPACNELAERLKLKFRDVIEPKIPSISVIGIPMQNDGSGIVIIRCTPSRLAPHRHIPSRECYIRRADRSEKMTMREIQDHTINIERGNNYISKEFEESKGRFNTHHEKHNRFSSGGFSLRLTAIPTTPLDIGRPYKEPRLRPCQGEILIILDDENPVNCRPISTAHQHQPILRGVRTFESRDRGLTEWNIYSNATIEVFFIETFTHLVSTQFIFLPEWVISAVGNMLRTISRVRRSASVEDIEFGLQIQFTIDKKPLPVSRYGDGPPRRFSVLEEGVHNFPTYAVYSIDEFADLIREIEQDFWNSTGRDFPSQLIIDKDQFQRDG